MSTAGNTTARAEFVPTPVDANAAADLVAALRSRAIGDVDTAPRRLAEYSSDASNYRIVPSAVVFPRSADELATIADEARERGVPLHLRGAGTSIAGNAIGRGLVVDTSRHLNRIHSIDPEAGTASVDPGVVVARLQDAALPHGLRFGPDPSTWTRCTIGGMIGNNACGAHSLAFGRTDENVVDLDVIDGLGRRFTAADDLAVVPGLNEFVRRHLATIRLEFGRFGRQVSGYALEALLPERGHSLKSLLVGSEGTLGVVTRATVRLVPVPNAPVTVVLGYPSMVAAANDVPALLACKPGAIEGLDARLVNAVREHKGAAAVSALPEGAGWLLIEMPGESAQDALDRAHALVAASTSVAHTIQPDAALARPIWRIREDGVGLAGRGPNGRQAWPGFEDAAVPPERLGEYLERFEQLTARHDVDGMSYGHFGDGCIHVRLTFPLEFGGESLRSFMLDAGDLVAEFGGSISGEHGDGRARGELLPKMYSPEAIRAFGELKALFDPRNVLNPDVLVDPAPLDLDLRRPHALPIPRVRGGFSFEHDEGDLTNAVHRCVGIGKCRADNGPAGGFMCPSYQATRDEKDSTRARARMLQEVANGSLVRGFDAKELHDSLDLCLSCKACASDCPAGVDMAQYKSEALYRAYQGKLRPMRHYVLGQLPRWTPLLSAIAPVVNAAMSLDWVRRLALPLAGVDSRRRIPRVSGTTFRAQRRRAERAGLAVAASAPQQPGARRVMLWADSFSNGFAPGVDHDVAEVLAGAGFEVVSPSEAVCCGLTWISTGQLDGARARLAKLMDVFAPIVDAGVPIVGVEPSCTAVLRSDLLELFPDDPRAKRIAEATFTLSEVLTGRAPVHPDESWTAPRLDGVELVVQPHCHQYAVMGFQADRALLEAAGASVTQLAGCCGLAGNFGLEKGHYDVSVAVAENALLPALREAPEGAIFLADGFSCRTQAEQLHGTRGVHLASLLLRGRDAAQ